MTITSDMETLEASLFLDNVPDNWTKRAYPSLLPLGQWFSDFMTRLKELENWAADFSVNIFYTLNEMIYLMHVFILIAPISSLACWIFQSSIIPHCYYAANCSKERMAVR